MTRPISILIAEDDPESLKFYRAIIQLALPKVLIHSAHNTEEALALFYTHRHDIILSDHRMPNVGDGLRLAAEICKVKPHAIFYFITADDIAQIVEENNEICVVSIFPKPVEIRKLIQKMREDIDEITEN